MKLSSISSSPIDEGLRNYLAAGAAGLALSAGSIGCNQPKAPTAPQTSSSATSGYKIIDGGDHYLVTASGSGMDKEDAVESAIQNAKSKVTKQVNGEFRQVSVVNQHSNGRTATVTIKVPKPGKTAKIIDLD